MPAWPSLPHCVESGIHKACIEYVEYERDRASAYAARLRVAVEALTCYSGRPMCAKAIEALAAIGPLPELPTGTGE